MWKRDGSEDCSCWDRGNCGDCSEWRGGSVGSEAGRWGHYRIAEMYYHGQNVGGRNLERALEWYESAARSGSHRAQLKLARGYEGRDLRACEMVKGQNVHRALALYEAAAKTSAEAQLVMAVHYEGMRRSRFKIEGTYEMPR